MRLQSRSKVHHANDGVDDGENDEKNGNDSEGSERLLHGLIRILELGRVDSDQFEDEVAEAAQVEDDDHDHAHLVLLISEVGSAEQDENGDRDSGDGQSKFGIALLGNDDDELDDEAQEEEEIELQESDVDLIVEESLLHAIVGTNVLQNVPGIFLIDLPRDEAHADSSHGNDGGYSDEEGLHIIPEVLVRFLEGVPFSKNLNGLVDLVNLDRGVDHKSKVGEAHSNNLNGVLLTESIPDNDQGVQETEDEQSQEGGNGLGLRLNLIQLDILQVGLKFGKYVSLKNNT